MIVPTAAQMLKTAESTFETVIKPDLQSTATRSAAASVGHMLRLATLRIETEGQILFDEAALLNALLPRVRGWLDARGGAEASIAARPPLGPTVYPSLAIMADEVGALRQGVCHALEALEGADRDAAGDDLLAELKAYVGWQLDQEGRMIGPATIGFGPRR